MFPRKSSLNLIKKMVHYIQPSLLTDMCCNDSPTYGLGTMLVEVIANVLDNEVSDDVYSLRREFVYLFINVILSNIFSLLTG